MGQFDTPKSLQSEFGAASIKPAATHLNAVDLSDYRNPFPNGLAMPNESGDALQKHKDKDLERMYDFRLKSADELKPIPPREESEFSLKVGGTNLPVGDGIDIWDLRSSIINEAGTSRFDNRDPAAANHNYGPEINQRYEFKKPSFGLTWHHKF